MATIKPDLTRVWAENAPAGNVIDPNDTTPGKFSNGWQAEVPPFEHFNFIQKLQTQGLAHINEQGIPVWDADTVYPVNAIVKGSDGKLYKAASEQSGNDPTSTSGFWRDYDVENRVIRVGSVAELRDFDPSTSDKVLALVEDAAAGLIPVYWDSTSTEVDDGRNAFQVSGIETGRWITGKIDRPAGNKSLPDYFDEVVGLTKGSSLVDKLLAAGSPDGMYFRSIPGGCAVGIQFDKDLKSVVEYKFRYDGDNLLLLSGAYAGVADPAKTAARATNLVGSFNTVSAPNSYTTVVGDSFDIVFSGTKISFTGLKESRGGLWRFIAINSDNKIVDKKDISVYSESTGLVEIPIFNNLPYDDYTVRAVFQGADPDFPPSSTPARGYLYYSPDDSSPAVGNYGFGAPIIEDSAADILTQNTVSDFAIKAKPEGAAYGTEWVPEHGSTNGVSGDVLVKIIIDGETVSSTAGGSPSIDYKQIESFKISQSFNALNPNGADGVMWRHAIEHSMVRGDYKLNITQAAYFDQDTIVDVGYWSMLGAESSPSNLLRVVLDNGYKRSPIPQDDSSDIFGSDVTSMAFVGELATGNFYGLALEHESLREAISLGKEWQIDNPGLIQYRATGIAKGYWAFAEGVTIPQGAVLTSRSSYSLVAGVRGQNEAIVSIG